MQTENQQYKNLVKQWFNGTESDDEAHALHTCLQDSARLPELISALEQEYNSLSAGDYPEQQALELAEKIIGPAEKEKGKRRSLNTWWAAAASLLLVAGAAVYFLASHNRPAGTISDGKVAAIQPGRQGAVLTLADGSQVSLDSVQNATISLQGGVTAKVINGVLVYEGAGDKVVYNTISTAKGRQYRVTLPDGSGIWLNAASSIRYPTSFSGAARQVEITGEAYFEIAENADKPFMVEVNKKAIVQVLGTNFNINAYDNEPQIAATLLEGSILAAPVQNKAAVVKLRPGQQALMVSGRAAGEPPVVKMLNVADMEKVVAWKNGLFNFNGASLAEVMKQLERWYDIEVIYEKSIPEKRLMGKMTKDISLEGLLIGLKELGVNCRLEGRKLIILP
ncbi:FecR family protein [uncultured Chitinophaga sp.]|uniref:FecR family protein n=1 Tax=uncultured Chitinophaga sp. TaxID=339340 RepID=UPI0025D9236E|nr:FecR domain-containing protein [uncultured Chitinophaga sp.]